MESRRMTTRSSRRAATPLAVSPVKEAVMVNVVQGAVKATVKRSVRKVLADRTNVTPVAGLVPSKTPKKAAVVGAAAMEEKAVSPCRQVQSLEQQPATPVVVRGEDLLRSVVHSNLALVLTPEGLARQSPEVETPQFGVPAGPFQAEDMTREAEGTAGAEQEVTIPPKQGEVVDARPPLKTSPEREVTCVSERLSCAWVGRDVDEVTEVGEDDDSDCSVLVNVSSPCMINIQSIAPPSPETSLPPTTPASADFKWQRRDEVAKVKEQDIGSYYGGEDEYEGCDEYEEAEDYDGEVIDCEEICAGISRISVAEGGLPEHKGRHVRFNYNSDDDEIDVEEVDVMRLRGLQTPMGKHLRFPEDEVATP